MVKLENDCCGCELPCIGSACPLTKVLHLYCDGCDEEVDELYEYEDKQLCESCLLQLVPKVEVD